MSPHLRWTPVSLWPCPCSGSHGPCLMDGERVQHCLLQRGPVSELRRPRGHSWGTCRCPPALPGETRAALEERKSPRFMERGRSCQMPAAAASPVSPSPDQNGQQSSPAGSLPGHFAEEERGFYMLFKNPMGAAEEWVTSH